MVLLPDLVDLLPHTVSHAALTGRDDFGAPTYGAATEYAARVVYEPKLVRSAPGDVVVAAGYVWLNGAPAVDPADRITLPDATTPPIVSVERFPDEGGDHHTKVYFGPGIV